MTDNHTAVDATEASDRTNAPTSIEAIVGKLEDAVAVDRPRRDLRLTDSISQDIRLDSLALLEVLTRVEEEFDIELIDSPETFAATTVGDLARLIQSKVTAGADGVRPGRDSDA